MKCKNLQKRYGKFKISRHTLAFTDRLLGLFRYFIVVRAECHYATDCIEYLAMSPLFDEIEVGTEAPEYEFIISDSEFKAQKVGGNSPIKVIPFE